MDPRGIKGSWEALVFYVNPEKAKRIKTLGAAAQWFEDHMPFDPRFRKPNVTGIVANAIDVVIEMGDSGPITPIGINLPNDEQIRERYGSKSVALANVTEAHDKSTPEGLTSEFTWDSTETERSKRFRSLSDELHTELHEVLGHASGRQAPGFTGSPDEIIKEHYSALEEARADLIALYFIADPKLVELGVVPAADHEQVVRAQYDYYTRNAIVQLRRIREGTEIEEAHLRNRQLIVHWLMANTKAIERRQRDGKTFNVLVDPQAFRDGVGRLLAEVQRIKSEGDAAAAAKLFNAHGIHFDPKLRDEVVRRVDALKLPSYTGFVMPKLTPVTDASGRITDVRISYPQDLTAQMLEYSARTR
jgi:dipeptidyl-peptidase-3